MSLVPNRMHPPRRWGQNFLVNQGAADTIVIAFRPQPSDLVLEVGPGRGILTRRLAGRVEKLLAVEIDPALAADLQAELGSIASLEIVRSDILDLDLEARLGAMGATPGRPARVIANLPYAIATTIILRLLEKRALLSDLLVLVQKEVAERIASPPGRKTYGGLSVLCQARARVETLLRLKAGSFRPIPKVESMLVRLVPFARPGAGPPAPGSQPGHGGPGRTLEALLRAAFATRRKTLLNNLARLAGAGGVAIGSSRAESLIRGAGLDPGARPEEIAVDGFLTLWRGLADL